MSSTLFVALDHAASSRPASRQAGLARTAIILSMAAGAAAGLLTLGTVSSAHAVAQAGPELTRLLRAMAGLKALMAGAALAAVLWRLAIPAGPARVACYAFAAAAMAAGPGLIAGMDHVAGGALLLHAGLLATILMLWRDPGTGECLNEALCRRRARLAMLQR